MVISGLLPNQGIYYTATASANSAIVNVTFNPQNGPTAINDIWELPNGDLWFAFRAHRTYNYR
jgi:hypothetical protein